MHHGLKPRRALGTALLLGEAAAAGRNRKLADLRTKPHDGIEGPRAPGTIGFASLRAALSSGNTRDLGERRRTHRAQPQSRRRAIFAKGALRAALWGQGKGPGLFTMKDVLALDRT